MNEEQLHAMRHSLAHITAQAVQRLWPGAKFGVGPVVENGFYYDIDLGDTKISEANFGKIEKEMRKLLAPTMLLSAAKSQLTRRLSGQRRPRSRTSLNCLMI